MNFSRFSFRRSLSDSVIAAGLLGLFAAILLSGCSLLGGIGGIPGGLTNSPPVITNSPPVVVPSAKSAHMTTFLRNNASRTSHVLMSAKLSDADREELIAYNKAQGYNVLYIYLANEGDYGGRSVAYRHEDRDLWRKWLGKVRDAGSRPIIWMCADDSPGLSRRTDAEWRALVKLFMADCGDILRASKAEFCTGLECNERWTAARTQGLTKMLLEETGLPVGVHTTGISAIDYAKGARTYYLQTGFGKSASEIASQVKQAKGKFGGDVILAEYSKSGETEAAKLLGDAGLDAGADGVGNGCHPTKAQGPPTTGTVGRLLGAKWEGYPGIRLHAPSIETNKIRVVDGTDCVGMLMVDGEKAEWIGKGRGGKTSIKNILNKADKRYYRPGFENQKTHAFSFADVDGKNESNRILLDLP